MAVTVEYSEEQGSPRVSLNEGRFAGTRTLLCAWGDALRLITELLGTVQTNPSGEVVYLNPEAFPGIPAARVRSCSFEPYPGAGVYASGSDTKTATYEQARVTVNYETPTFDPGDPGQPSGPEAFISENLVSSVSFLTIGPVDTFWDNAQTQRLDFQTPIAIPVSTMDYTYHRRRVPGLAQELLDFVGHCNSSSIVSDRLGWTFAAETMFYMGAEISRETVLLPDGTQSILAWDIKQRYKVRSYSWNHFYKPGTSTPAPIYNSAGTQIKYIPTADFTLIRG